MLGAFRWTIVLQFHCFWVLRTSNLLTATAFVLCLFCSLYLVQTHCISLRNCLIVSAGNLGSNGKLFPRWVRQVPVTSIALFRASAESLQ
ncbi:hypothetical protein BDQ12DRAFT_678366 [Crucibulum laeve]|uniref:Uncharacterized protein n=1 Tax=Crucibulum laeve TaxID=68775 RepID=A0A5C3M8Q7_9AGAR|nr:hypothetical protein BDQ12DRAFT_678366 [Crucibulum laeve]